MFKLRRDNSKGHSTWARNKHERDALKTLKEGADG